jgi:hypothetical protein
MVFQPPQEMSKVSALEAVSIEEVNGSFGTGNDTKRLEAGVEVANGTAIDVGRPIATGTPRWGIPADFAANSCVYFTADSEGLAKAIPLQSNKPPNENLLARKAPIREKQEALSGTDTVDCANPGIAFWIRLAYRISDSYARHIRAIPVASGDP